MNLIFEPKILLLIVVFVFELAKGDFPYKAGLCPRPDPKEVKTHEVSLLIIAPNGQSISLI